MKRKIFSFLVVLVLGGTMMVGAAVPAHAWVDTNVGIDQTGVGECGPKDLVCFAEEGIEWTLWWTDYTLESPSVSCVIDACVQTPTPICISTRNSGCSNPIYCDDNPVAGPEFPCRKGTTDQDTFQLCVYESGGSTRVCVGGDCSERGGGLCECPPDTVHPLCTPYDGSSEDN